MEIYRRFVKSYLRRIAVLAGRFKVDREDKERGIQSASHRVRTMFRTVTSGTIV